MRRVSTVVMTCVALIAGAAVWGTRAAEATQPLTPAEHVRTADQTFLTFPEWYLVHSPAEYAAYLAGNSRVSGFPLFAHIGQFWQAYDAVNREIVKKYPFNAGYHLMVMVIGLSTTLEYGLKGVYEHTVGRIAEATRSGETVPEERFAAKYAQAYVDFIRIDPWYQFDFWSRFTELWADSPLRGPNLVRRWERRFVLSTELLAKEAYARLIKLGTQSIYDAPKPVTAVLLSRTPAAGDDRFSEFHRLAGASAAPVLATIPRYEAFTRYSAWLAGQGIDFVEIAGNRGDVLVSVLVTDVWAGAAVRVLFEQPILTQPGRKRVVYATPVAQLANELRRAAAAAPAQVLVEHVYDF